MSESDNYITLCDAFLGTGPAQPSPEIIAPIKYIYINLLLKFTLGEWREGCVWEDIRLVVVEAYTKQGYTKQGFSLLAQSDIIYMHIIGLHNVQGKIHHNHRHMVKRADASLNNLPDCESD